GSNASIIAASTGDSGPAPTTSELLRTASRAVSRVSARAARSPMRTLRGYGVIAFSLEGVVRVRPFGRAGCPAIRAQRAYQADDAEKDQTQGEEPAHARERDVQVPAEQPPEQYAQEDQRKRQRERVGAVRSHRRISSWPR